MGTGARPIMVNLAGGCYRPGWRRVHEGPRLARAGPLSISQGTPGSGTWAQPRSPTASPVPGALIGPGRAGPRAPQPADQLSCGGSGHGRGGYKFGKSGRWAPPRTWATGWRGPDKRSGLVQMSFARRSSSALAQASWLALATRISSVGWNRRVKLGITGTNLRTPSSPASSGLRW